MWNFRGKLLLVNSLKALAVLLNLHTIVRGLAHGTAVA